MHIRNQIQLKFGLRVDSLSTHVVFLGNSPTNALRPYPIHCVILQDI